MTGANESLFTLPVTIAVEDQGKSWVFLFFGDRPLTIGRSSECDIALEAPKASRRHAEILAEDDHFILVDSGSANGTQVNGERVKRELLRPGDVIQVGRSRIVFGEASLEPPSPRPVLRAEPLGVPSRKRSRPTPSVIVLNTVMPIILLGFLAVLVRTCRRKPNRL